MKNKIKQVLIKYRNAITVSVSLGVGFLVGFILFGTIMINKQKQCNKDFLAVDNKVMLKQIQQYYGHELLHGNVFNHMESFVYMYVGKCELRK